ncbi:MAG TPA: nuclear transport factor 2 family protein [Pyrinomonadaceae bacterium]|nr:nuclear transport factor 2 family protein [Pyrinomonadaceae bacterium]
MKRLTPAALAAALLLPILGAAVICRGQTGTNKRRVARAGAVRGKINGQNKPDNEREEEALKNLVREWADAAVHADLAKLDRIQADNFQGSAAGKDFDKRMLREALRSGALKVAAWTVEDMDVKITGNTAVVTGKSTLTNAVFMGTDYSGEYEWTDRFVRQRDGTWRAVTSHAKLIKK